jgi:uncharacterized protein
LSVLYADTSALVRAYFADEPDHGPLRHLRAGRLPDPQVVLDRFDGDYRDDGPLTLLRLAAEEVLPVAYRMVIDRRLRTLDALHLAVALIDATALADGDGVTVVTRDLEQARAARAAGLAVA